MKLGNSTKATLLMALCAVLAWGATYGAGYFWHDHLVRSESAYGSYNQTEQMCYIYLYDCAIPYERTCSVSPSGMSENIDIQSNAAGDCDQANLADVMICKLNKIDYLLKKLDCKPKK